MSESIAPVRTTTEELLAWCRRCEWAGADPYDGLNSRIFQALPFLHHRWPRLVLIQSLKRSPINLRRLLGVPPGVNPKGIALFLSSLVRLAGVGLATEADIRAMADRLISLRSPGWRRACWGYHFDWQTRTYLVPRGYPNIICTTFAGEALLDAHERLGDAGLLERAVEAGWFLLEDLKRTEAAGGFCFSYTPLRPSRVHNASLLGAALLARLHARTGESAFREAAEAATRFGIAHQAADGSWIYGEDSNQGWIDSFHTGYNLLALKSVADHLGSTAAADSLGRGFAFYRKHFFAPDGVVKYYHDRIYPIDTHAVAHAILTLVELERLDPANRPLALEIIGWAGREMRHRDGYYYYQRHEGYTNRIPYLRWTQAWMLLGLSAFVARPASPISQGPESPGVSHPLRSPPPPFRA